jgi:hypothetical protein
LRALRQQREVADDSRTNAVSTHHRASTALNTQPTAYLGPPATTTRDSSFSSPSRLNPQAESYHPTHHRSSQPARDQPCALATSRPTTVFRYPRADDRRLSASEDPDQID